MKKVSLTTPYALDNFLEFYNISQYFTVFVKGFNLLNNNVNTVSLARTHRGMQTSSFEIRVQYGPPACGRRSILDPNFSGFRSAFADASSPDSRHCPSFFDKVEYHYELFIS